MLPVKSYELNSLQLNLSTMVILGTEESGRCSEVAIEERYPLWRGSRCGEVTVVER